MMGWLQKMAVPGALGRSAVSKALADLAAHHELDADKDRASGNVLGFEVVLSRDVVELTGRGGQTAERLLVKVNLPKPLDAGLRVTMIAQSDPRRPFSTGYADFDGRFVCLCDEPGRGRALVSPEVRALLLDGPEIDIGDGGLTIAIAEVDAGRLGDALGHALEIARALEQARLATPVASALQPIADSWRAAASELPLAIEPTPLSAELRAGRITAEARAVRDGFAQHHFELHARFAKALYVGLRLRPFSASHEYGRQAEPLGDATFDRLFDASAKHTPVLPLFDAEVRGRLVALRGEGLQVRGDDRGLTAWLGGRQKHADSPVRLLAPLAELAEALAARVEAAPAANGPS